MKNQNVIVASEPDGEDTGIILDENTTHVIVKMYHSGEEMMVKRAAAIPISSEEVPLKYRKDKLAKILKYMIFSSIVLFMNTGCSSMPTMKQTLTFTGAVLGGSPGSQPEPIKPVITVDGPHQVNIQDDNGKTLTCMQIGNTISGCN